MIFKHILAILVIYFFSRGVDAQTRIDAGNGSDRGKWGDAEFCPPGSYATRIQSKYEEPGQIDDTYLNAIKLLCFNEVGNMVGYVVSKEGKKGDWKGTSRCPYEGKIIGYSMKVQEPAGTFHDDFAVTDVLFACEDGTLLHAVETGLVEASVSDEEKQFPSVKRSRPAAIPLTEDENDVAPLSKPDELWGPWAMCEMGSFVCGMVTRVERNSLATDDAGLCDLNLYCCVYID